MRLPIVASLTKCSIIPLQEYQNCHISWKVTRPYLQNSYCFYGTDKLIAGFKAGYLWALPLVTQIQCTFSSSPFLQHHFLTVSSCSCILQVSSHPRRPKLRQHGIPKWRCIIHVWKQSRPEELWRAYPLGRTVEMSLRQHHQHLDCG